MKSQTGFTLTEIAVVITVVGLLIGSLLIPLSTQLDGAKINSTNETLVQIKEALLRYAVSNKRLPCPANAATNTGAEDSTFCAKQGLLPWVTLGIGQYDAWGHPFQYRVHKKYTEDNGLCIFSNNSAGTCLPPNKTNMAVEIENTSLLDDVAVVVFSYGKNGHHDSIPAADNILRKEDVANPDSYFRNNDFNTYYYAKGNYLPNRFDDTLIWLTRPALVDPLMAAGKMQVAANVSYNGITLPSNDGIVLISPPVDCTIFPNWGGCVSDRKIDWCQQNCPDLNGNDFINRDVGNTDPPQ